jgi:hypothetical protein
MSSSFAPDLTPFVVAFVLVDLLAVLALLGVATGAATAFFARHRSVRTARHQRVLPYYGHVALGH